MWEPIDTYQRRKDRKELIIPAAREQAERRWPNSRLVRAYTKNAMNGLIQGGAADQTKKAMLTMWRENGSVPYLQVHDEINNPVSSEAEKERDTKIMMEAIELSIPMKVDSELKEHWS